MRGGGESREVQPLEARQHGDQPRPQVAASRDGLKKPDGGNLRLAVVVERQRPGLAQELGERLVERRQRTGHAARLPGDSLCQRGLHARRVGAGALKRLGHAGATAAVAQQ